MIWRQQAKDTIDRHSVSSGELDRILQTEKHRNRPRQPFDAGVRNGNTPTKASAAQSLAFFDTLKHMLSIKPVDLREAGGEFGENLLLGFGSNDANSLGINGK